MKRMWLIFVLCCSISIYVAEGKSKITRDTIHVAPLLHGLVKNPVMGWGIYSDAYNPDMKFWEKFDALHIEKFATHLYIRWPWSAFEPEKGRFAWDHDPFFKLLEQGAKKRGLKLAFRVYVDSRDYATGSTPDYVRIAGAKGFVGNTKQWSPYADDPIFQHLYANFLQSFAKRYDDSDIVDFVDGFGLGLWGEGHSMKLFEATNYDSMYKWIVELYSTLFKNVLVAINYHHEIGKERLDMAYQEHGFILRHDAFGMGYYYGDFERNMVKTYFPVSPIIAESGWWHNGSDAWLKDDPANYKTWRDVWKQTLKDALAARANILDLRNISETRSWIKEAPGLVNEFIEQGGYRLYPAQVISSSSWKRNRSISIHHVWKNLGIGVMPNNAKQWNYKYKVAFSLIDSKSNNVKTVWIDYKSDPSKWLKENATAYDFETIIPKSLSRGKYKLGVAIVDTQKDNRPRINLAIQEKSLIDGWVILKEIKVE